MEELVLQNGIETEAPGLEIPAPLPALKVKAPIHWWLVLLTVAAAAALVYWFGIRPRITPATINVPDYITAQVTRRDFTVSVSGSATVQSAESMNVSSLVKGEILSAPFEEGQTIGVGDLLYVIDSSDLVATIEKSELSVQKAQNSYNDILKNIETTKSDRAKAASELALTAPAGGIVTVLNVEVGDSVNVGTVIAEIVDRENLLLKIPFHSAAAATMTVGQAATVTVEGASLTLAGTVTKIAPLDEAGPGGTLVRTVTIAVQNPGTVHESTVGTATVGSASSAATGTFSYAARETVTAKKAGTIAALHLTEGGRVQKGQTVLELDREEALASYDKQLETLQNNARDSALSLQDAITSLENTRSQLDNYTIYSTIDGTVIEKNIAQGDNIEGTSSGALAVLFNMNRLQFDLNIDELDIGKIEVGQTVLITAEAVSGKSFTGSVARINYNGRSSGGVTTYPVTILVDNVEGLLPGMNITAEILVEEAYDVLSVPINAVQRGGTVQIPGEGAIAEDGSMDESKFVSVPVTTGRTNASFIEIVSGLEEGDTVIIQTQLSNTGGMFQMGGGMMVMGAGEAVSVTRVGGGGGGSFTIRGAP